MKPKKRVGGRANASGITDGGIIANEAVRQLACEVDEVIRLNVNA